ncbi:putative alcohol dehydrogenase [Actinobacillus pleuropneumoniae]|nr:alcohol dehydrogenase [Actinobacillus pleuropneumoniae]KIE88126.1 putative alcohol dehydrogenase [Actinobacillus pleuropneumoniae]
MMKMRAAVVAPQCDGTVEIVERDIPEIKNGEALLKLNIAAYVIPIYTSLPAITVKNRVVS